MSDQSDTANSDSGTTMPVPDEHKSNQESSQDPAVELIRRKVSNVYSDAPDPAVETVDLALSGATSHLSKHQKYLYDLTNAGKSLAQIQQEWADYYAGLSDIEKHEVWQEYSQAHAQALNEGQTQPNINSSSYGEETKAKQANEIPKRKNESIHDLKEAIIPTSVSRKKPRAGSHIQSLLFGLGVGSIVVFIFLFSFFNERFIAPFIQPSRNISSTPIINDGTQVGATPRVIIPKINVEVPVNYEVKTTSEAEVQKALEGGVVHYADTAVPGQDGNLVIVGHSSSNIFNRGKYKFAFVLLSRLDKGDTFYLDKDGKRYTYQVFERKIVKPTEVSVLGNVSGKPAVATLITCDPPGTSANRLVVVGEQISPEVSTNLAKSSSNAVAVKTAVVPGNSPTLWAHIWQLLSR